jgi:hypothetical protein
MRGESPTSLAVRRSISGYLGVDVEDALALAEATEV